MKVAIIMGSDSDWDVMSPAVEILKEMGIETEVVVASAHRTPAKVHEFAEGAAGRGVGAIIAAAGAAAHLPGVVACCRPDFVHCSAAAQRIFSAH